MNVNNSRLRVPQGRPDGGQFATGPTAVAATHLPSTVTNSPAADLLDVGVGAGLAALLPPSVRRRVLERTQGAPPDDRAEAGRSAALDLHATRDARHQGPLTSARAIEIEAEAHQEWGAARRGLRDAHALVNAHASAHPDDPLPRALLDRLGFQAADLAGAQRRLTHARTDRIALAGLDVSAAHPWQREAVAQASLRVADPQYRGAMHHDAWEEPTRSDSHMRQVSAPTPGATMPTTQIRPRRDPLTRRQFSTPRDTRWDGVEWVTETGEYHRTNGPAIIHQDGTEEWIVSGHQLAHRSPDGHTSWTVRTSTMGDRDGSREEALAAAQEEGDFPRVWAIEAFDALHSDDVTGA